MDNIGEGIDGQGLAGGGDCSSGCIWLIRNLGESSSRASEVLRFSARVPADSC